ncbi:hypothetical protein MOSE0_M11276 [Monosporozyma servazzii]
MERGKKEDYIINTSDSEFNQNKSEKEEPHIINGTFEMHTPRILHDSRMYVFVIMLMLVYFIFGREDRTILECPVEIKSGRYYSEGYLRVTRQIIPKGEKCGFNSTSEEFQKFYKETYETFKYDFNKGIVSKVYPFKRGEHEDEKSLIIIQFTRIEGIPFSEAWPRFPAETKFETFRKMLF